MLEPRYVLLVRAPELDDPPVLSAYGDYRLLTWAEARAAWDWAMMPPNAGLVYEVLEAFRVDEPDDVPDIAGDAARTQAWMEPQWAADHVRESEALRSPPPCPLCEAGHVPLRPCP